MEEKINEIETGKLTEIDPPSGKPPARPAAEKIKTLITPGLGKKLAVILGVVISLLIILAVIIGLPLYKTYNDSQKAYQLALKIKDAAKSQDIKKTSEAITAAKNQVKVVRKDLEALSWTKYVPVMGSYTSDLFHAAAAGQYGLEAGEIVANAIEPYADILGLKGQGTFSGGTAEDRITKAVETLDKITPQIDKVAAKIDLIKKEVDAIDPNRYPETLAGKSVRPRIVDLKQIVSLSDELLSQAGPMVKQLPDLLGVNGERKYLILFQNDAELRPTGGFITAYAIFRVDKGRIHLDSANDIYQLDNTLTRNVAPPDPIVRYLNVYGWRLRDSNFSPDFESSMKTFEDLYNSSKAKQKINGIITVDTHVLIKLLDVMGPIQAYGTTFTTKKVPECNCAMVIYELEKYADQPVGYTRDSRKDIIGVLLSEVLKKAMASPRQIYGPLTQAMFDQAQQKHILFYLNNLDAQKGVEALNLAGQIKTVPGDYLHINDANLGGAKSNLFIVEKVTQDVSVTDTGAASKLVIDYRYPHQADNCSLERKSGLCLAGIYRDYLRVYLPKGATVDSVQGFESKSRTYEDLGHTVVDGYFTVVPQGLAKIQISYKVPGDFKKTGTYTSLIQKQPGTNAVSYQVSVNGQLQQFDLLTDKELTVKL